MIRVIGFTFNPINHKYTCNNYNIITNSYYSLLGEILKDEWESIKTWKDAFKIMSKRYRINIKPYPPHHEMICNLLLRTPKWSRIKKVITNIRIDPIKRKNLWLLVIGKLYMGSTATRVLQR